MFSIIWTCTRQSPHAARSFPTAARLLHTSIPRNNRKCPSCSKPLPTTLPACTHCSHISSLPRDTKFHDIFDLPYEPNPFVVDVSLLKKRFRDAQALCHPDSWASKGSSKQDVAQALSARINEAYQSLLKPLSRAEYILQRHHIPVSETDQVNDIQFMSEIMEARETIEEAESESEVLNVLDEARSGIHRTVDELEALIGEEQWEDAKSAAVRLRYLEGIERAAKRWLDDHS